MMTWKRLYHESYGEHLCEFSKDEVLDLLDSNQNSGNTRFNRANIQKYLDYSSSDDTIYCGLLDEHGRCGALAVLSQNNPEQGYCFLLEIQSFMKGSGAKLIHKLIDDKYPKLWFMADPSAEDSLLSYYRRPEFDLNEFVVEDSIYDSPLHIFYTQDCDSDLIEDTSMGNWEKRTT